MKVPCGQCIGCRIERGRQWTVRLMHEAQMHEHKCFITLTYADEHLPADGSLVKSHFQQFIQRFRDAVRPKRISYFMCGEYGEVNWRPHYHAIVFGHDFGGLVYRKDFAWSRAERLADWRGTCVPSEELKKYWPLGHNAVGPVTAQSAGYVARYCLKKVTGVLADEHYKRVNPDTGEIVWLLPEYAHMSTRPAIGKAWFDRFASDVSGYDGVFVDGKRGKPPRYYDKLRRRVDDSGMYRAKLERKRRAFDRASDGTPERLGVREEVARARISVFSKRRL